MVQPAAGEAQARRNVLANQIGQFVEDLICGEPIREKIKHIDHANAHSPHARATTALCWIHRDSLNRVGQDGAAKQYNEPSIQDALSWGGIRRMESLETEKYRKAAAPLLVTAWTDAVFHVLAHVRGTAHLRASVYDPAYVAWCERLLGPAMGRPLRGDAQALARVLPTHELLAGAQALAWLFSSPERAACCSGKDLAELVPEDVEQPQLLAPLRALGAPVEFLRAAAELEAPVHRLLPPPEVDLLGLEEALGRVAPAAPHLAEARVRVCRALRLRGRLLGEEIVVGLAPTLEHMAWQAAHEATVAELLEYPAGLRADDPLEREAIATLTRRARSAGLELSHRRWLSHLRLD